MLDIEDLTIGAVGAAPLVAGVSLRVAAGERVGLVGESGCGKTLTCLAALGLLPPGIGVRAGAVRLGDLVLAAPGRDRPPRGVAGRRVAMVFQDPAAALNPVLTIGRQLAEPMIAHRGLSRRAAAAEAAALLAAVGVADPERRMAQYPHQLSGGLNQRAVIAMALAAEPQVLIADEPTTALDVTVQAQILDLLDRLQARHGFALLLVTHDLGVVAETADRVAVMYAGGLVEDGPVAEVLAAPAHPYTAALLASIPRPDAPTARLRAIPGQVPAPGERGVGCAFAPRCDRAAPLCRDRAPRLTPASGRTVACHAPLVAAGGDARRRAS